MACRSGLTRGWDAWPPAFAGVTKERLGVTLAINCNAIYQPL